jgi:hypothetical protein
MIGALSVGLLLAVAPAFDSADELQQWLTYYYLKPRPELVISSLALLDQQIQRATGTTLADQARRPGMRTFYAQLFAHDDAAATQVGRRLKSLPSSQRPFVRESLRRCGTSACARALGDRRPPPTPAAELSAQELDDLWAAFAATGEEAYVREVIARVVGGRAPRLSLRSNAYQHERVLQICERVMGESLGAALVLLDDVVGFAKAERLQHPPAEPK